MKNLYALVLLSLILFPKLSEAQFKVLQGDYVLLSFKNSDYTSIQWQQSTNGEVWTDVADATTDSLFFQTNSSFTNDIYYRAQLEFSACTGHEINSETLHLTFIDNEFELQPGDIFRGGKIFFNDANQTKLIASPSDDTTAVRWGCVLVGIFTNVQFGEINTNNIINTCTQRPIAASVCYDSQRGGYTDWYLPAEEEIKRLRFAAPFVGGFTLSYYWTSTATGTGFQNNRARSISSMSGISYSDHRNETFGVRCIRPFLTQDTAKFEFQLNSQDLITTLENQPESMVVCAGNEASFTVNTLGATPVNYQWFFMGEPIAEATQSTLTIPVVSTDNQGDYTCTITTVCGEIVSESAALTVVDLSVLVQPENTVTCVGQGLQVNGMAETTNTEASGQLTYAWEPALLFAESTNPNTIFSPVQPTEITLQVTDQNGCMASDTAFILVQPILEILQNVQDSTVCAQTEFTFTVEGSGAEPISYQWFKNEVLLTGETNAVLLIENVLETSAGEYQVQLSDACTTVLSNTANLVVLIPALVEESPDASACLGTTLSVSPSVSGSTPISYAWLKDGEPLAGQNNATLLLENLGSENDAHYTLQAENSCGAVQGNTFKVNVIENSVSISGLAEVCFGATAQLSALGQSNYPSISDAFTYQWQPTDLVSETIENQLISEPLLEVTTFSVLAADSLGCTAQASFTIFTVEPYAEQVLCFVSHTDAADEIELRWEKNLDVGVELYKLYGQTSIDSGEPVLLGNAAVEEDAVFFFTNTAGYQQFFISVVDTCQNESVLSPYLSPIFLAVNTLEQSNELAWSALQSQEIPLAVEQFFIYRKLLTAQHYQKIDSVSANTLLYVDADNSAMFSYKVSAQMQSSCESEEEVESFSNPANSSFSTNIGAIERQGSGKLQLTVFPNPVLNGYTLKLSGLQDIQPYDFYLFNAQGKLVQQQINQSTKELELQRGNLPSGLYSIQLVYLNEVYTLKVAFL
ncbi:MAG: immunoglobulin domain-containing protein [Luteibaculaceae bacterium]